MMKLPPVTVANFPVLSSGTGTNSWMKVTMTFPSRVGLPEKVPVPGMSGFPR